MNLLTGESEKLIVVKRVLTVVSDFLTVVTASLIGVNPLTGVSLRLTGENNPLTGEIPHSTKVSLITRISRPIISITQIISHSMIQSLSCNKFLVHQFSC